MTRAGRQLFLKLRDEQGVLLPEDPTVPWGGRSPRSLTDAFIRFSLPQETANREVDDWGDEYLDEQCRRHFNGS